jgi:hypothetical protein
MITGRSLVSDAAGRDPVPEHRSKPAAAVASHSRRSGSRTDSGFRNLVNAIEIPVTAGKEIRDTLNSNLVRIVNYQTRYRYSG